jgi:hypothetical protein
MSYEVFLSTHVQKYGLEGRIETLLDLWDREIKDTLVGGILAPTIMQKIWYDITLNRNIWKKA